MRRYLITAIELHSHTGFALAFNWHNSLMAQMVLKLAHDLFPDKQIVLIDNGGEFKADFDCALERAGLIALAHLFQDTQDECALREV